MTLPKSFIIQIVIKPFLFQSRFDERGPKVGSRNRKSFEIGTASTLLGTSLIAQRNTGPTSAVSSSKITG